MDKLSLTNAIMRVASSDFQVSDAKDIAAAADDHVGLLGVGLGEFLEVLVETDGNLLFLVLDDLHALAAHEVLLLVGCEIFLADDASYGTVLHKDNGIAEPFVLNLQGHADEEGTVFGHLDEFLQSGLGAFLQVGVGHRAEKRCATQRAGREDSEECLTAFGLVKFLDYPFEIFFGVVGNDVVLYNMYIHNQRVFAIGDVKYILQSYNFFSLFTEFMYICTLKG